MTKTEMLRKLLQQSGWTVTNQTDEDGYKVVVASEDKEAIK